MMNKLEAAARQALEWIEDATVVLSHTSTAVQGGIGAEAEGVGGCSVKVLKDLREALAEQAAEPVAWMPIETAPKDGRKVIMFYLNSNNKARTVMARWLTDEEAAETDGDDVGLEGGWYECIDNWGDYTEVAIHEGDPSHWMPLPKAPTTHGITGSKKGGAA